MATPATATEYPDFTDNAKTVLDRRYLKTDVNTRLPTETPDDMLWRVARNLAQADASYGAGPQEVEDTAHEFYHVMRTLEFLPNSPTLMNAGRELQQLSACFVLPVDDSLFDIFTTVRSAALIHQSGGGTGFAFSRLRPEGDTVRSTGKIASGPASFIRAFDVGTDVVKQGGTRRGANMGVLSVYHPDVLKFVHSKADGVSLSNFNISIAVDAPFMERAARGETYDLVNPRTNLNAGSLNAADVFRDIVQQAWTTGDPGLLFLDRMNADNPNPQLGQIETTNPCVTADTWTMTAQGPRQVADLIGRPYRSADSYGAHDTDDRGFYASGEQAVFRLETDEGYSVRLTANHLVKTVQSQDDHSVIYAFCPAQDLKPGDLVKIQVHDVDPSWPAPPQGDRCAKTDFQILHQKRDAFADKPQNLRDALMSSSRYHQELAALTANQWGEAQEQPPAYLIDAGNFAPHLQLMLNRLGVNCARDDQGCLTVVGNDLAALGDAIKYYALLSTLDSLTRLRRDNPPGHALRHATFRALEPDGYAEVYDVTIPGNPEFDANGLHLHNCGEQSLLPYESCNLGSINLTRMTRPKADGTMELDHDKLRQVATTAVHMLDNVIDMNAYPLPEIEAVTKSTRRIGVGVMGFADLLIQLGIRYDSQEGLDTAGHVMAMVRNAVYKASQQLAEARGPFPEWERSSYADGPPMRNSAPTTIAPTGTISIIAGASSGIEPLFALAFVRTVMDGAELAEVNEAFQDALTHVSANSHSLVQEIVRGGGHLPEQHPDVTNEMRHVFRTAHEISPIWHVRMQAAFQAHTDNAVSKTVNLPHDATPEDVAEVYRAAHRLGCKGITVYRDGSKADQVLATERSPNGAHETTPALYKRPRPDMLDGNTQRLRTGHGNAYITINMDADRMPFEVFANIGKAGSCDDVTMHSLTRMISLAFRYGIPTEDIIEQLRGSACCPAWDHGQLVGSTPDAIAIALQRFTNPGAIPPEPEGSQRLLIPFAENVRGRQRCPVCNSTAVMQENCIVCYSCGWEKC